MRKENEVITDKPIDIVSQHDFFELIKRGHYKTRESIKELIANVSSYIKAIEEDNYNIISEPRKQNMSSSCTDGLLREYERNQYNIWILQYLVSFISKLPLEEDIAEEIVDPFEQFKSFVFYNVRLLRKSEIIKTVLRYPLEYGIVKHNLFGFFKWRTDKNFKEISKLIQSADKPLIEGWRKLFTALQRLSLFWFSVKNKNLKVIRKLDIYIYLLTQILLERISRKYH